jgi:hypothetical protein
MHRGLPCFCSGLASTGASSYSSSDSGSAGSNAKVQVYDTNKSAMHGVQGAI